MNRVDQLKAIQQEALDLFAKKECGLWRCVCQVWGNRRIEDKIQRSMSITKNGVNLVYDEGIRDTLIDLHNYAAMALMLLNE
jgi:hypothetical protein